MMKEGENLPSEQDSSFGGLEKCITLLKGSNDEQRLVGLLLATKYVQGNDKDSVRKIFNAVGAQFINRLLKSGVQVKGGTTSDDEPYVQLAMSVLSAFCRVPELASLDEVIDKIPTLLDILKRKPAFTIRNDCLECLLCIASFSSKGLSHLQHSRPLPLFIEVLSSSAKDPGFIHSSIKVMQLLLRSDMAEQEIGEYAAELVTILPVLAELFSAEQGSLKFEILHLIKSFSSQKTLVQDLIERNSNAEKDWLKFIRSGVSQVLNEPVAIEQKYMSLEVTESMVALFGRSFLLGSMALPGEKATTLPDRFFLLLVETLRVETLVILHEVAMSRFDTECAKSSKSEKITSRQQVLATCYALLESIIGIIIEEEDDKVLTDIVLTQTISALNEIINTLLEFLKEAQRQNLRKGDDLLASIRLLSRYLADAVPFQKNFRTSFLSMLEFLFTITSDSEESPFFAVQLLLPVLCQVTTEIEGCRALVSWGGHKQVSAFMLEVIHRGGSLGLIVKAGDVMLNLLQKETRLDEYYDAHDFLPLLSVLPSWADNLHESIGTSIAACICVMILDLTNEDQLLKWTSMEVLSKTYGVVIRTLSFLQQLDTFPEAEECDLWQFCLSASLDVVNRYPSFKLSLKSSSLSAENAMLKKATKLSLLLSD